MSSSSLLTVRVDKATSYLLLGPDWTMNMEICDSINMDPGLAKDVVRAVKKKLQHKSSMVQFLALTLLETMIKNCGDFVHFQVVEREIPQEMVKIVKKKTNMEVRDKILVLLDSWQEAFGGSGGKYPQYFWAYLDLKRHGVDFPRRPEDATLRYASPTAVNTSLDFSMAGNSPLRLEQSMPSASPMSPLDLDRIRGVMDLLADMLKAANPEAIKDDEVIVDLADQCRSNQKKVLQSIESTGDEKILGQSLALNDSLQSLLAKHDAMASGSPLPDKASQPVHTSTFPLADATIAPSRFEDGDEEDDDEFAQLARRNSRMKPTSQTKYTTEITRNESGSETASFFTEAHPLALPEPPPPIKTITSTVGKQQDIIDLLSITLYSSSPQPHTPNTPPTPLNSRMNPKSPQAYPVNQDYIPYAAPWSQSQALSSQAEAQQLHLQAPQFRRYGDYPPPPWEDDLNYFTEPTYRFQTFSIPSNSSGTNATTTGESPAASLKPFVPSYRLFDDLADVSNPNNGVAGRRTGSPANKV